MNLLELLVACEIQRYLKDDEIRILVRSKSTSVEVEATRGSVTRTITDDDPCRHGIIISTWCHRTAEKIGRMVRS